MTQTGKIVSVIFNDDNYVDKVELNLGDYEIIEEHGKTYAVKKKKEYPKTYEECLVELIGDNPSYDEKYQLLETFRELLICRDAYWKIAGEEMGLGKPWEPDYTDPDQDRYAIVNFMGNIEKVKWDYGYSTTFVFPIEEMQNTFKENFDPDIEICKEFL